VAGAVSGLKARAGLRDGWVTEEQIATIVGRALTTKPKARRRH
jgi:hypothetical protein